MSASLATEADISTDAIDEPLIAAAGMGLFQTNDIARFDVGYVNHHVHPSPMSSRVALISSRSVDAARRPASA